MYFDLRDSEASSFLVFSRFTSVDGPMRLVRFTDSSRGFEAAYGGFDSRSGIHRSYWMYASEVEELLDQVSSGNHGPHGLALIREISERWAISDDWGDLQRAWVMNIPGGKKIDGYCGRAKFQPRISVSKQAETGRKTTNSYKGESMQFILGVSEEHKKWINGPLPTLSLSRRKLAKLGAG